MQPNKYFTVVIKFCFQKRIKITMKKTPDIPRFELTYISEVERTDISIIGEKF